MVTRQEIAELRSQTGLNGTASVEDLHNFQELQLESRPRYLAEIMASAAAINGKVDDHFSAEMQSVHSSYFAGGTNRYLPQPPGINPFGTGADYHYPTELQYFLAVERARHDDRDNMVIGQAINRLVANILRTGFSLQAVTGKESVDAEVNQDWSEWAENKDACDYDGERTFNEMMELSLRDTIVAGDIFGLPTKSGRLQMVENHHCRNPVSRFNRINNGTGIVHGVELNNGRRVAYHFAPDDLEPHQVVSRRTRMQRIDARDKQGNRQVFHLHQAKRFSQRRGVSSLVPIVFPTRYHDDLQFAALVNAKRNSFLAIIRQLDVNAEPRTGPVKPAGSRSTSTRDDGTTQTTEGGGPGQTLSSDIPGEKITPWVARVPTAEFFEHSALLMAIMAINLDLPELVFRLDGSQTNFNGYRAVIEQARMRFESIQRQLRCQGHEEVYAWRIRRRLAADPIFRRAHERGEINAFGHRFQPAAWPYVQPVQDAAADDLRLNRNLTSHRRRSQEHGSEWPGLSTEIVDDRGILIEKAIDRAIGLNKKAKDGGLEPVGWRDLAFGNEGGVRVNLTGAIEGEESKVTRGPAGRGGGNQQPDGDDDE